MADRRNRSAEDRAYEEYLRRVHPEALEDWEDDEELDEDDYDEDFEDDEDEEIIIERRVERRRSPAPVRKKKTTKKKPRVVYVEDDDEEEEVRYVRRKKKKKGGGFLFLLLLLAILLGGVIWLFASRFGNIHSVEDPSAFSQEQEKKMSEEALTSKAMQDYTNIALFGVDSREEELLSGNNRSDMVMILSIHKKTGDCKILSVYRDTYLDIGDGTYTKCNAAYAYGGPEQAVAMLNRNFDLNVTDFVTIGFGGLANLIDAVGGVEIEVEEQEIHGINDYQSTMAVELGRDYKRVETPGRQTLDGLQAVGYCRIRYTAGDDYRRTERQREVLMQTFNKAKRLDPVTLNKITQTVFQEAATSLSMTEALTLVGRAVTLSIADTAGCPVAEHRTTGTVDGQSCIIPRSLEANVRWMHAFLFGEADYQASSQVREISANIDARTAGIP